MIKVYLVVDPKTGRALYDDERKLLGTYDSVTQAAVELGHDILKWCKIDHA